MSSSLPAQATPAFAELLDLPCLGDVHDVGQDLAATRLELGLYLAQALAIDVAQGQPRPPPGELARDLRPQPARGTRHDHHFTVEIRHGSPRPVNATSLALPSSFTPARGYSSGIVPTASSIAA
jgi:hypothetical protein